MSDFSEERFSDSDDEDSDVQPANAQRRQDDMDKLVAPLDPGEYGKMPASFHENSQTFKEAMEDEDEAAVPDHPDPVHPPAAEAESPIRNRPPILARDKYDGVDSDDESDEEEQNDLVLEEDGEDEEELQINAFQATDSDFNSDF